MIGSRIASVETALPVRELTNAELARTTGRDEAWIEARTGIRSRRIAAEADTAATLGSIAAERALRSAEVHASDVDLIICATVTSDRRFPSTACLIQSALGSTAAAFDLNAGCSGFLYALAQADATIRAGVAERVLVVGAEVMSRITDYSDPKTAILFGDGAGAALVERCAGSGAMGPFLLFSDGSRPELLYVDPLSSTIKMEGREVYRAAVTSMVDSVTRVLRETRTDPDEVGLVIAHQANQRILEAVAARLGLPSSKMFSNISRYGNTSSASIPVALAEADASGALADGDLVVLTAFGAGFVWGAGLVRWSSRVVATPVLAGMSNADV